MGLTPGTKLGPYEILAPLGAGGMGEVYRARDTRLDRTVAIKILPPHLANDPIRKQRFEREAKSISGLNHPNICTLHDVGSQDGIDYLVMECVEGESLSQRLEKGALPVEQVLKIGREIADALDKAHRSGIIHRDLKPGNIMLTKAGAKLLDFGLARPASQAATLATMTATGSRHSAVTQEGTIVGTFQYMSPEQVEGKELDPRSDIFSLGAVLYEMLTGQRAFEGKSQLSVASAILEKEPAPISTLKPMSPRSLEHVIRRCLAKDPDDRWQTARDVSLKLSSVTESVSVPQTLVRPRMPMWKILREWLAWSVVGLLLFGFAYFYMRPRVSSEQFQRPIRASILPPDKHLIPWSNSAAVSPDGHLLVFSAHDLQDYSQLWLRPIESLVARPLPGTEGGYLPFWSPDSRWIAFYSGSKLKKISIDGGMPLEICDGPQGRGGTWGPDGTILFVPGFGIPISSVPSSGGTPVPVTRLDKSLQELTHRWPEFLPDGKHFLFFSRGSQNAIYVGLLGSNQRKLILKNDSNAIYVPPGYLLFAKNGVLMAQSFDANRMELSGTALPIADDVPTQGITQHALFSASNNGIISIQPKLGKQVQPVWVDRSGKVVEVLADPAMYSDEVLSPNGQRVALVIVDPQDGSFNTWLLDLRGRQKTRLTFEPSVGQDPVWSPDGNEVIFASNRLGVNKIFRIPATGIGQAELYLPSEDSDAPTSWSFDGRYIAFIRNPVDKPDKKSLWILPTFGDKKPYHLIERVDSIGDAAFSPNGKWIAFQSDETGHSEVYVVPFPKADRQIPISSGGGWAPRWSRDGRELFYLNFDGMLISASVHEAENKLQVSDAHPLFKTTSSTFGVSPDGKRFLVYKDADDQPTSAITLVIDWMKGLPR